MIIEQLICTVIAFGLFVYMFLKMIQKNDTNYTIILAIQAIGILINLIAVFSKNEIGIVPTLLKYIFGIIIPVIVIILEKRGMPLFQIVNVAKAQIYFKLGNNKKAKEALIAIVSKDPENYIGHKMLAGIYEIEGGMRKAIDEYVQAIDINKKDYDSYYKVAELLNGLDKSEEASEMLFNLLNKKPDYYKATELLGEILINKERYKDAVNVYQNALRYNPLSFELNYNLGIAYTMLNDFQNAKICYEKAAEINSLSYNSKYSLAEIAMIYKELEEAEKYFMQVLEDDELSVDSYFELAKIEIIRGDRDKAIQYANVAIDINAKKVVPKIKKDPLFIPVMAKLSMPFNLEEPEGFETKLSDIEIKSKEHLEDMFEITRNLGYDDIKMLKQNDSGKSKKEVEQNENQKERD